MKVTTKTDLLKEIAELRARLEEVEETLRAISAGEVDALVMKDRVYTLHGAETPYRILVEAMNEIALTLAPDGTISYCNGRLSELLRVPHESIIGTPLRRFVTPPDHPKFDAMFAESQKCSSKGEVGLELHRLREDHELLVAGERDEGDVHSEARRLAEGRADRDGRLELRQEAHPALEEVE